MEVDFSKIATSKRVYRECCEKRGKTFRWGYLEDDDYDASGKAHDFSRGYLTEGRPKRVSVKRPTVGGWLGLEQPLFEERDPEKALKLAGELHVSPAFPMNISRGRVIEMGILSR